MTELLERIATNLEVLIAAVLALVAVIRTGKVLRGTDEINRAVNRRPATDPKLYDLVKDTNSEVRRLGRRFDEHIGWHKGVDDTREHVGGED